MTRHLACLLLAALLLSSCGSSTDRTGKPAQGRVTVLTMGNFNFTPGELQPFADQVSRLSGGRMKIRFVNDVRKGQLDQEQAVIDDVRAGTYDLGWAGSRAFDAVGATAFAAFQAPLLIDSYEAERAVLRSPVPGAALKTLEPLGVAPVGVLPGPMRKLVAVKKPILEPADMKGARTAFTGGPASEHALRALGADPVRIAASTEWAGWDAAEAQLSSIAGNNYEESASHLSSNVNLWPRYPVVYASKKLSSDQIALLRRAAAAAITPGLAYIQDGERAAMKKLCGSIDVANASPAQLDALRSAARPAYAAIAKDATAGPLLKQLESIRDTVAGPASPAPSCAKGASSALEGTWEGSVMVVGNLNHLRWVIKDGHYKQYQLIGGRWTVGDEGTITVFRDHLKAVSSGDGAATTARWTIDGDALQLSDYSSNDPIGTAIYAGHPWRRAAP